MSKLKTQKALRSLPLGGHNSNLKSDVKYRAYQFSLLAINFVGQLPNKKAFWIKDDVEKVLNEAVELSNMIGSSLLTMKVKKKI